MGKLKDLSYPPRKNRLVAIDPGATQIGLATFENGQLIDHAVRLISRDGSVRERLLKIEEMIGTHFDEKKPGDIAIERSNFSHRGQNGLLVLAHYKILAIARRRKIPVHEYAPITIRKVVAGHGHATKEDVMKVITKRYPELKIFSGSIRSYQRQAMYNMYDAIAVGLTHLKKAREGGEAKTGRK